MQRSCQIARYRSVKEELLLHCPQHSYARVSETMYSGLHGRGKVVGKLAWAPGKRKFKPAVAFTDSQAIVGFACDRAAVRAKN